MTQPLGHEKLIVYQQGMRFVAVRSDLLERLPRRVAACDHLNRGSESILVNIAHASSAWSPNERIVYLGHANGSSLEQPDLLNAVFLPQLVVTQRQRVFDAQVFPPVVALWVNDQVRPFADRKRVIDGGLCVAGGHGSAVMDDGLCVPGGHGPVRYNPWLLFR